MPSYPSNHFRGVAPRVLGKSTRRNRRQASAPEIVSVKALQPDDRPRQPKLGGMWIETKTVTATARKSEKPRGWSGVVASADLGQVRPMVRQSSEIRPPVLRDFTGGKAERPVTARGLIADRLAGNPAPSARKSWD